MRTIVMPLVVLCSVLAVQAKGIKLRSGGFFVPADLQSAVPKYKDLQSETRASMRIKKSLY